MKRIALIVLAALLTGVVAPPSLPFLHAAGSEAMLGTLDVCHQNAPALSPSGDMPCMSECSGHPVPCTRTAVIAVDAPRFHHLLLTSRDERPPPSLISSLPTADKQIL
jgi:hypothetical protein